jgi:hypothetical protein
MFGSSPQKQFLKAAASGDTVTLNQCLNQEIPKLYDIDARNGAGRTALILAAKEGKVDTLKILIEKKADVNAWDSDGRTALWWASYKGRRECAKLLLAAGAQANTHDNDYYYALHYAASNGDVDIVKDLVEAGAELNPATKTYQQTPLHLAVENNRNPVVELLLSSGARTDVKDCNSYTPYDRAKSMSRKQLVDLLENPPRRPAAAAQPVTPAPPARTPEVVGDSWILLTGDTVAHVNVYPPVNRKLTEIFNFANRERTVLSENLKTGAETMTPPEKFETLAEDILSRAEAQLKLLGGAVPDKNQKKAFNL